MISMSLSRWAAAVLVGITLTLLTGCGSSTDANEIPVDDVEANDLHQREVEAEEQMHHQEQQATSSAAESAGYGESRQIGD